MPLSEHILDVDESTFEREVIQRSYEVPVVVDFWAAWCGPCRVLGPILERLAIEAGGGFRLAKVDVDANPRLAIRFGVQGIPAVRAFRQGEVAAEFVGAQPESAVRRFLERIAPSEAAQAIENAASLLATRHWPEAEAAFRAVLEQDEANSRAALGLTQALLMLGRGSEARALLGRFPPGQEWATAERLKPLAEVLAGLKDDEDEEPADPLDAQLRQAARLIGRGNLPAAMDGLLDILRQDKSYRKGLPKDLLLALFTLLGEGDPLTREYRDELASVLF
ncbi:MAG TPA: tetratricopeptide repeat protein [Anaerolineales bacterium]|nr:tetratricopeptide repeat protein [Anaerolineales bacterium]